MIEAEIALSASTETPGDPMQRVIRATLRNRGGAGIPGARVRFTLDGPGSLDPRRAVTATSDVTNTDGFAWARWFARPGDDGTAEARVMASADVDDAELLIDHFFHTTAVGPFAPAPV